MISVFPTSTPSSTLALAGRGAALIVPSKMKILFIALAALALAPFSSGAVVTYSFTGVIGAVEMNENGILGAINPGDSVSGSFSFDPLIANGGSAADRTLTFMIGSRDISMSTTLNFLRTQNDVSVFGLGVVDRFRYGFDSNGPTTSLIPSTFTNSTSSSLIPRHQYMTERNPSTLT